MLIVTRNSYNKQVVSLLSGLIAPVATAATSVTGTSFVANWNAYDGATTYYLDVSTSPTFATFVLQNQAVLAPATSYTVTGLTACTYYYYRVRAEGNKPTISIAPTLSPSGTQFTGTLITCGTGTWNSQGSTFNYQWKRNGVSISGATSSTYTLQVADEGTTITCEVQNQNAFGKSPYVVTSNSVSASAFQGVLDLYPNASVAYSVRKLRAAYAGSAIRVRRSSDNAEQDIGFLPNGNLDENALTSFVGANNGFVTTWYDQSGNGNNAIQTTAANQSQIVNAGVIYKTNGKPSILFDGSDDFYTLNTTILPNSNGNYQSFVSKRNAVSNRIFFLGGNRYFAGTWSDNLNYLFAKSNIYINSTSSYSLANQNLFTGLVNNAGNQEIYIDGNIITTSANSFPFNCVLNTIGNYIVGTGYTNGYLQESVYYDFDQTSNKSGIETNINTYYAIY